MGSTKRQVKGGKPSQPTRQRQTRSKGRVADYSDPALNTQLLTDQLRSLGLYAAATLGDGNCLFRALADQLYGSPQHHLHLRREICDWIEGHKARYEPFCEDERGLDTHLSCMRQPGTYGGHMELTAFAHLTRRDVKVIQPGLVYIIEAADLLPSTDAPSPSSSPSTSTAPPLPDDPSLDAREKRRLRRDRMRADKQEKARAAEAEAEAEAEGETEAGAPKVGPVYVAYHDWEHFSSIRNLRGPHVGLPEVCETPASGSGSAPQSSSAPAPTSSSRSAPTSSTRKARSPSSRLASKPPSSRTAPPSGAARATIRIRHSARSTPGTPSQVPLPPSRSPSPAPHMNIDGLLEIDGHPQKFRSPKRTFDESSCSSQALSESSGSNANANDQAAKRSRSRLASPTHSAPPAVYPAEPEPSPATLEAEAEDGDGDDEHEEDMMAVDDAADADTPSLSQSSDSNSASSSPLSSPEPTPPPPSAAPSSPPSSPRRTLTKRERKKLGLPKAHVAGGGSPGKITIPGGKYRAGMAPSPKVKRAAQGQGQEKEEAEGEDGEWRRNGTGRMDVRGFRELKI